MATTKGRKVRGRASSEPRGPSALAAMSDLLGDGALTERHAAKYLGISAATLRLWRAQGKGPNFFHAGDRLIRYRKADIDRWIASRLSQQSS